MDQPRSPWTPQDVLWELGASFLDATADTAAATIESAIACVAVLLDASAAGVWLMDHRTQQSVNLHNWSIDETMKRARHASGFEQGNRVSPTPEVADALIAGKGLAIVDLELIVGKDICEERGWQGGRALVATVHQTRAETIVFVLGAASENWNDRALELIRGTVLLLRQFHRRIQAENHLRELQRLNQLTGTLAARFQSVSPETLDDEVDRALREVRSIMSADAVVLIDVIDDRTVHIPHMIAKNALPEEWMTIPIPDISVLPGCEGMTIRDFVSEPRVMDVAEMVDGLMGREMSDALGLRTPPRTVALLPASLNNGAALMAVSLLGDKEWEQQELDALSTLASQIAQTRGRVVAEKATQDLFNAQRTLAAAARSFLNATLDTWLNAVNETLANIGNFLGADIGSTLTVPSDRTDLRLDRVWTSRPTALVSEGHTLDVRSFPLGDLSAVEKTTFISGAPADFVSGLPEEVMGDWCGMVAPIHGGGSRPEYLAFGWMGPPAVDTSDAADLVTAVADLVSQLYVRLRAEEEVLTRLRLDETLSDLAETFLTITLENAGTALVSALETFGERLNFRGIALRRVSEGSLEVEASWAPAGMPRPAVGATVSIESMLIDPEILSPFKTGDAIQWSPLSESVWGPGVNVHAVPIRVAGDVEALLNVAFSHPLTVHEIEVVRSLGMMLGHLRLRLAEERQGLRRLATHRLLSLCAQDLAEATPDDFEARIVTTLERAAKFSGLGGVVLWQVDHVRRRYIREATWVDPLYGGQPSDNRDFGTGGVLDAARETGEIQEQLVDQPTVQDPARIAVPRTDGKNSQYILLGASIEPGRFADEVREVLTSLSQTMQEVGSRIRSERYSRAAFEDAPIGVVLRDELLGLITCNQAFVDFVGATSVDELIGTEPHYVYDNADEVIEWVREPNGQETAEAAFRGPDGVQVWGQIWTSLVTGSGGEKFWLSHIEDVTERRQVEKLFRFQATHDELTGLANRRRLLDEIHRRLAGPGSVGVLLLDLDRFKNINDSLGHNRGDELLVLIADRLRFAVRPCDLVGRLGGDEFAIVLPGPVDVEEAESVAERLMRVIGEPVTLGRQKIYPTASIGIAVSDETTEVNDLLSRADVAMYRAKAQGRGRTTSYDAELSDAVHARMETEAGLRHALRNDELLVYYQPEVSLDDGRLLGAEALIRWNHPEKGILPAAAFIDIAEETGLVVEMGEIVLAQACREAILWPGGDDGPMIRVNLASAQIQREETVSLVRSVLAETGLAPHRLCLEITESAVMADIDRSEEILRQLKALGIHLAVDDFGTGFSSLAYLKRFPVDALKIDRTFVTDLGHNTEDVAFVRSIISLADALDLDVVAEGVETEVQATILLELGCHRAQGYLFARPGPPAALLDHLAKLV
ncbi:MAG: diguanylate cyclase (GGDEF)-like protein/PAS domain S-box-containing protein [Candidatus Aldehydirespiratoraceae bacterium]|jgi:diguanylate cyclase (GGDEF)-like protein/PAS domain S-box-containing protein